MSPVEVQEMQHQAPYTKRSRRSFMAGLPSNDPALQILAKRQRLQDAVHFAPLVNNDNKQVAAVTTTGSIPATALNDCLPGSSRRTAGTSQPCAANVHFSLSAKSPAPPTVPEGFEPIVTPDGLPLGLRGLNNLGNTCFMSSVLQAFVHTPLVRSFYLGQGHCSGTCSRRGHGTRPCLSCEMDGLFSAMYSGARQPFSPSDLLYAWWCGADKLAEYQQQDAHEFYLSALAGISGSIIHTVLPPAPAAVKVTVTGGGQTTGRESSPQVLPLSRTPSAGISSVNGTPAPDIGVPSNTATSLSGLTNDGVRAATPASDEDGILTAGAARGEEPSASSQLARPPSASSTPDTTSAHLVESVFGGLLRSDVTCCVCGHMSTAYDPFLDISLDLFAVLGQQHKQPQQQKQQKQKHKRPGSGVGSGFTFDTPQVCQHAEDSVTIKPDISKGDVRAEEAAVQASNAAGKQVMASNDSVLSLSMMAATPKDEPSIAKDEPMDACPVQGGDDQDASLNVPGSVKLSPARSDSETRATNGSAGPDCAAEASQHGPDSPDHVDDTTARSQASENSDSMQPDDGSIDSHGSAPGRADVMQGDSVDSKVTSNQRRATSKDRGTIGKSRLAATTTRRDVRSQEKQEQHRREEQNDAKPTSVAEDIQDQVLPSADIHGTKARESVAGGVETPALPLATCGSTDDLLGSQAEAGGDRSCIVSRAVSESAADIDTVAGGIGTRTGTDVAKQEDGMHEDGAHDLTEQPHGVNHDDADQPHEPPSLHNPTSKPPLAKGSKNLTSGQAKSRTSASGRCGECYTCLNRYLKKGCMRRATTLKTTVASKSVSPAMSMANSEDKQQTDAGDSHDHDHDDDDSGDDQVGDHAGSKQHADGDVDGGVGKNKGEGADDARKSPTAFTETDTAQHANQGTGGAVGPQKRKRVNKELLMLLAGKTTGDGVDRVVAAAEADAQAARVQASGATGTRRSRPSSRQQVHIDDAGTTRSGNAEASPVCEGEESKMSVGDAITTDCARGVGTSAAAGRMKAAAVQHASKSASKQHDLLLSRKDVVQEPVSETVALSTELRPTAKVQGHTHVHGASKSAGKGSHDNTPSSSAEGSEARQGSTEVEGGVSRAGMKKTDRTVRVKQGNKRRRSETGECDALQCKQSQALKPRESDNAQSEPILKASDVHKHEQNDVCRAAALPPGADEIGEKLCLASEPSLAHGVAATDGNTAALGNPLDNDIESLATLPQATSDPANPPDTNTKQQDQQQQELEDVIEVEEVSPSRRKQALVAADAPSPALSSPASRADLEAIYIDSSAELSFMTSEQPSASPPALSQPDGANDAAATPRAAAAAAQAAAVANEAVAATAEGAAPATGDRSVSLEACLQHFAHEEALHEEEAWVCSHCKKHQPAVKQMSIRRLPPVLCMHAKRFEHDFGSSRVIRKLQASLAFPLEGLDMTPYLTATKLQERLSLAMSMPVSPSPYPVKRRNASSPSAISNTGLSLLQTNDGVKQEDADMNKSTRVDGQERQSGPLDSQLSDLDTTYSLYAVIVHIGDISGGHYIAYIRCCGAWFCCDDAWITMVEEEEVLSAQAYMLFYVQARYDRDHAEYLLTDD